MLDGQTVCSDLSASVLPHPGSTPDPLPRRSLETCQMFTKVFNVYLRWDQPDGGTCMDKCWSNCICGLYVAGSAMSDGGLSGDFSSEVPAKVCELSCGTFYTTLQRQLENEADDYKRGHFTSWVKRENQFFRFGYSQQSFVQYSQWFWISFDMGGYLKAFSKCI